MKLRLGGGWVSYWWFGQNSYLILSDSRIIVSNLIFKNLENVSSVGNLYKVFQRKGLKLSRTFLKMLNSYYMPVVTFNLCCYDHSSLTEYLNPNEQPLSTL